METFIKKHLLNTNNHKDRISIQELSQLYNQDNKCNLYINTFSFQLNKIIPVVKRRYKNFNNPISLIKGYKFKSQEEPENLILFFHGN